VPPVELDGPVANFSRTRADASFIPLRSPGSLAGVDRSKVRFAGHAPLNQYRRITSGAREDRFDVGCFNSPSCDWRRTVVSRFSY